MKLDYSVASIPSRSEHVNIINEFCRSREALARIVFEDVESARRKQCGLAWAAKKLKADCKVTRRANEIYLLKSNV